MVILLPYNTNESNFYCIAFSYLFKSLSGAVYWKTIHQVKVGQKCSVSYMFSWNFFIQIQFFIQHPTQYTIYSNRVEHFCTCKIFHKIFLQCNNLAKISHVFHTTLKVAHRWK